MEKELQEILDAIEIKQAEIQEAAKKSATREEIEAIRKELTDLKDVKQAAELKAISDKLEAAMATIVGLEEVAQKQGETITEWKERGMSNGGFKTEKEAFVAALHEKKADIANFVAGKANAPLRVEFNVAVVESVEATIAAGATQVSITQNTGIISTIRKRELRYLANVSVGNVGNSKAMWIEELDEQGEPTFIGEGDGKSQASVLYVEKTQDVK